MEIELLNGLSITSLKIETCNALHKAIPVKFPLELITCIAGTINQLIEKKIIRKGRYRTFILQKLPANSSKGKSASTVFKLP